MTDSKGSRLISAARSELQAVGSITHDPSRRALLGRSAAAAAAGMTALASAGSSAAAVPVATSNLGLGRAIPEAEYGMPSKFEAHVKRRRTDVLVNRQNFSDWSMTPLHQQLSRRNNR